MAHNKTDNNKRTPKKKQTHIRQLKPDNHLIEIRRISRD